MELGLRVTLPPYGALVRNATVHVFLTSAPDVDVIPVKLGGTTDLPGLRFELPSSQLPASTLVGVDCFVEECNEGGVWCWQRVGSASIRLTDLRRGGAAEASFVHQSSRRVQGRVICSARFTQEVRISKPCRHEWVPEQETVVEALLETYIEAEMDDLRRAASPSHPFLDRVHAPRHYSRVATLPGAAFWMEPPTLEADEAWCVHWITAVLARHDRDPAWLTGTTAAQFDATDLTSPAFHEVCSIICEAACAPVNSLAYISDWVPRRSSRQPCESFDEVFVRRSGDCEDGAKGIVEVLRCFQDGVWTTPLMHAVKRVCALYVPCGVLGMVDAPTVRHGTPQAFQAHMFMNWIPAARFNAMAGIEPAPSVPPWTRHLRTLNGEGTGHVDPSTQPFDHLPPDLKLAKLEARLQHPHPACRLPAFVDRMLRPSLVTGAAGSSFYHLHVHLYTNELLRRGPGSAAPAAFSFVRRSAPEIYGVAYDDVMRGDPDVVLLPHRPMDADVLSAIRGVLALEHPLPRLRYVREAPPSKVSHALEDYVRGKRRSLPYTDLYVRPTDLLDDRVEELRSTFRALGVQALDVVREYDPNGAEFCAVRLRCYFRHT